MRGDRGFIALISVIIISLVLVTVATTLGFSGFYGRYNVLDREMKEVSVRLAEACTEQALASLAIDSAYTGGETIDIGGETCTIGTVTGSTEKTMPVEAVHKNFHTNLTIVVDTSDFTIESWEEIP